MRIALLKRKFHVFDGLLRDTRKKSPHQGIVSGTIHHVELEVEIVIELQLLGMGADGETLVFTDDNGERYATPITDELRGAMRRDRPKLEVHSQDVRPALKPSTIQSLLRAGMTAEEIAEEHGVSVGFIEGFESPIITEKAYIVSRAQEVHIGAPDGPRMGDLIVDRLAARGVSPSSLTWSARREQSMPWEVAISFVQGAQELAAHWTFEPASGHLTAIDQEARWLTENSSAAPLQTIFSPSASLPRVEPDEADAHARELLVDQLNAARGKRVEIDLALDDPDADDADAIMAMLDEESAPASDQADTHLDAATQTPSISARIYSLAQARTKREQGEETGTIPAVPSASSVDAEDSVPTSISSDPSALPGLENMPVADGTTEKKTDKKRTKRRSVPSWDEIVFGSKP